MFNFPQLQAVTEQVSHGFGFQHPTLIDMLERVSVLPDQEAESSERAMASDMAPGRECIHLVLTPPTQAATPLGHVLFDCSPWCLATLCGQMHLIAACSYAKGRKHPVTAPFGHSALWIVYIVSKEF